MWSSWQQSHPFGYCLLMLCSPELDDEVGDDSNDQGEPNQESKESDKLHQSEASLTLHQQHSPVLLRESLTRDSSKERSSFSLRSLPIIS